MKGYNKKISDVYVFPLPYLIQELPPLAPHNPVSVVLYLWSLGSVLFSRPAQVFHDGKLDSGGQGVRVEDADSAMALWQQGFFGKGSLSRSEPSWFGRTARRLGLDGGEMSLEELTEMRRAKRRQFKKEREIIQQQALLAQMEAEGKSTAHIKLIEAEETDSIAPRDEDYKLIRGDTIERVEYLHLSPYEAVFLSLGLGILTIRDHQGETMSVQSQLKTLLSSPKIWREYVVYHYFRSMGWCVRSGVKFGCDWLLYRRGPPFQHAEFAILVMNSSDTQSWPWLHSHMRVVGSAKKTLMLCYVEGISSIPDWEAVEGVSGFRNQLRQFSVKPLTFARFSPSKNRD